MENMSKLSTSGIISYASTSDQKCFTSMLRLNVVNDSAVSLLVKTVNINVERLLSLHQVVSTTNVPYVIRRKLQNLMT